MFDAIPKEHWPREVVFFIPELNASGAQMVLVNLANGLARTGMVVEIVVCRSDGPLVKELDPVIKLVDLQAGYLLAIPRLIRYLRRRRPAALVAFYNAFTILPIFAKWLAHSSVRIVPTLHTMVTNVQTESPIRLLRFGYRVMTRVWKSMPRVVAVSQMVAEDLARYGIPLEHITVIYNPVLDPAFERKSLQSFDWHNWPTDTTPVIVGVGRLCHQKNFGALVRAFAILRNRLPAKLVIVGEGDERQTLVKLTNELGIAGDVFFTGFVENPVPYMKRASVLALTSRYEGLGNVAVEALAVGTPVVSYDTLPVREIIAPPGWISLVPPGDGALFADALLAAIQTGRPRHAIDMALLQEQFGVSGVVHQYGTLLAEVSSGAH